MVIFSSYVRRSLPFVSIFTSILMLEGSQLRLLNIISLLSAQVDLDRQGHNFQVTMKVYFIRIQSGICRSTIVIVISYIIL
jgi:hypothetical protein